MIGQKKKINCQAANEDKLAKIITSLRTTDKNAAIAKHSETSIKIKDVSSVSEEEALIKAEQLPNPLIKQYNYTTVSNITVMIVKSFLTSALYTQKILIT